MSTDEQFAHALREHASALTPQVTVRTEGVVPAARRRRAAQVGALTLVAGLVLGGGAFAGTVWAAGPEVVPAGPPSPPPAGPVASAPAPSRSADPGWPDAAYWHLLYTVRETAGGPPDDEVRIETWVGHTAPSVEVRSEGMPGAWSSPPGAFTTLLVGGVETELDWDDVYALPTDPVALEEVLRAGVILDDPNDPADHQVWKMASRLLLWAPSSPALREALWQVLVGLPGVATQEGATDSLGRPGVAATLDPGAGRSVWSIVYDRAASRGLEEIRRAGDASVISTLLEQGPSDAIPAEAAERAQQAEMTESVTVPAELVGMQANDASRLLASLGLSANLEPVPGTGLPMGVVARVAMMGEAVPPGSVILLQVSTG